ncbi:MAG: DASH family cryptochrome [Saprospiraceae bacterium]|nr:DASH family cryptochrome [Saprospiraceae bacterium]
MKKRGIVWFRQDLRLHDNEAIHEAIKLCDEIIYVYVLDSRLLDGRTSFGFPKMGNKRKVFLMDSVRDLKKNLRSRGVDLIVRSGLPEEVVFQLAQTYKTSWVFCNRERTEEEKNVQDSLEKRLWTIGQEICYSRGKMLYYTQDLPFPVNHAPDQFTSFRKEVEKITQVRTPLPEASSLKPFKDVEIKNEWPDHDSSYPEKGYAFRGGETEGLKRLRYYIWESEAVSTYKDTRNGMLGADDSSKFSPWLAHGCLSPKMIYEELTRYEEKVVANDSTYWLFFELLWRDFFRLMGKKHENKIFQLEGYTGGDEVSRDVDWTKFNKWRYGETGTPLVDAAMIELRTTGWLSNRSRQIVASYLINDLQLNWLMGAEWFESQLIDYDPCSNYGNWAYIAGVGSDTRPNRYFNVLSQARRYDPNGEYVKYWIPSLADLNEKIVHQPDRIEGKKPTVGGPIPDHYLNPIIGSGKWAS